MNKQQRNRVTYIIYCINAFAERYKLSAKQAFAYLQRFKGLVFWMNVMKPSTSFRLAIPLMISLLSVNETEEH